MSSKGKNDLCVKQDVKKGESSSKNNNDEEPPKKMQLSMEFFQKMKEKTNINDVCAIEILDEFEDLLFELGSE